MKLRAIRRRKAWAGRALVTFRVTGQMPNLVTLAIGDKFTIAGITRKPVWRAQ